MDLNFVDPPLDPSFESYALAIPGSRVSGEISEKAEWFDSSDFRDMWETSQLPDQFVATLGSEDLSSAYVEALPFVARFLTVELDTNVRENKGLGRLAKSDPPPRFGAKFGKSLRKPGATDEVGSAIEQLILDGFLACAVAFGGVAEEARGPGTDRSAEDRYREWLRSFAPTYWEVKATLDPEESLIGFLFTISAHPSNQRYEAACEAFKLGTSFGKKARRATYPNYFFAVGWALYWVSSSPE